MKNFKRLVALLSILAFISCGNEKKEEEKITIGEDSTLETINTKEGVSKTDTSAAMTDSIQVKEGIVEVMLTGDDQMKFNLKEIKVKAGQKVKLKLKHIGKLDKSVMGHNFVLLQPGTDIPQFAQNATEAKDNDYIPKDSEKVIVHTKLIGGGEETSIEFEVPAAGVYDFICSFPAHYVQMHGKFIVE